uniref:Fibronectin type-III domain-containing protein n=1 Tax=Amphimedon queenslandica TaxID=400682 RepID=A0A1X7SW79_AMPQE
MSTFFRHDGNCFPNGSYFWDGSIRPTPLECGLPGATLNGGQWIGPNGVVPCDGGNNTNVECTTGSGASLSVHIKSPKFLEAPGDGWYMCCLPTNCSDPNTNIIFANIFRFAHIESFTLADLPSDITVYPQEYKLNCTKMGHHEYGISMSIGSSALASYTNCDDDNSNNSPCPGTVMVSISNTIRYTVTITWDGMTVSSGSLSQSITGDQMYQCIVAVTDQPTKRRNVIIKVPATAPSSLTEVNKTATTITVSWTPLDSSDADGYVVNVTSDTDTVQTVQVEGSSNNTITLNGLRGGTTYIITVRAYQQLLGPASEIIVITYCQKEGIYLTHNGNCYPNGSYFWDSTVDLDTKALSCVLPGASLTTGQWVRVADPGDPVDCNSYNASDLFCCTNVTSPATLNFYLAGGLPADQEGWYKCCLPTDCSDPNTNVIFANIFRYTEIESFTVADLDMTVYPQEYKLNCVKIGIHLYGISISIGNTALTNFTGCKDDNSYSPCPGIVLVDSTNTVRYTVTMTWNGMIVSSGLISQSITGDQMYQCLLENPIGGDDRTRTLLIKVPQTAPSSLTEVNKTATTITVSWTAFDSSDADGYVVNVTSDTDTVQTVQVEGSSNNTITLNGLNIETTYSITVRAYQQLLGPASSAINVFTHCQQEGIYLGYNGKCYPNGSYFWDNSVNAVTKAISCVLLGTNLTTGQWVRVADPDDPVDCNSNSDSDPFRCTSVTSPATISLYLDQGLSANQEGWYKCCLPTDCSDPNTNIIFANIF